VRISWRLLSDGTYEHQPYHAECEIRLWCTPESVMAAGRPVIRKERPLTVFEADTEGFEIRFSRASWQRCRVARARSSNVST
jgi:hypothetical protein